MAKVKSAKGSQFPQTTFVNYRLDKDEKKACEAWFEKQKAIEDDLVVEILQSNHKITMSFDGNNDSFISSLTGKAEDCNNSGTCLTSRGSTPRQALWANLYKFHIVFKKGVWEDSEDASDWG